MNEPTPRLPNWRELWDVHIYFSQDDPSDDNATRLLNHVHRDVDSYIKELEEKLRKGEIV